MNSKIDQLRALAERLNPVEERVLLSLLDLSRPNGEYCVPFAPIQDDTGLSRDFVRAACRSLTDYKLAVYFSGLWTEDGEPAGSGYSITEDGASIAAMIAQAEATQ